MQVTIEEISALLGQKDIEIMALQKQLADMKKRIDELTPRQDVQPLKAVE